MLEEIVENGVVDEVEVLVFRTVDGEAENWDEEEVWVIVEAVLVEANGLDVIDAPNNEEEGVETAVFEDIWLNCVFVVEAVNSVLLEDCKVREDVVDCWLDVEDKLEDCWLLVDGCCDDWTATMEVELKLDCENVLLLMYTLNLLLPPQ